MQITPDRRCDQIILSILDTLKFGSFNEGSIRMAYYQSLIETQLPIMNEIAARAQQLGPRNHAIRELGLNIIRQFGEFDIDAMIETFREPLTKLGPNTDFKATLHTLLGLQMHRYCSNHFAAVQMQSAATLASMRQ